MKIHEYQAKEILKQYGLPVPLGIPVSSVEEVPQALAQMQGEQFVVKAQVHAGGRGKGGGVKFVPERGKVADMVKQILGMKLVTHQTGPQGKIVNKVLIQQAAVLKQEYYLGVTLDRAAAKGVVIASQAGGMDIEEVARTRPEAILKTNFDIASGLYPHQAREIAYQLTQDPELAKQFVFMIEKLAQVFIRLDANLVEINPLAITGSGKLEAIDAKIDFDDNAMYRHADMAQLRDPLEEDPREAEAKKYGLSYVGLDGNVGCMVNGAGLAMTTMDVIKLAGGEPANFLDVGGGATVEQVKAAFEIILRDANVKAILVNIFGGIMKCDVIAEGVIQAAKQTQIKVPLVVRLEGTNVELGRKKLQESGIKIHAATSLWEAAQKVVELVK